MIPIKNKFLGIFPLSYVVCEIAELISTENSPTITTGCKGVISNSSLYQIFISFCDVYWQLLFSKWQIQLKSLSECAVLIQFLSKSGEKFKKVTLTWVSSEYWGQVRKICTEKDLRRIQQVIEIFFILFDKLLFKILENNFQIEIFTTARAANAFKLFLDHMLLSSDLCCFSQTFSSWYSNQTSKAVFKKFS